MSASCLRTLKVLVVDDDAMARTTIRAYLSIPHDLTVVAAMADGQAAVNYVADHEVNVALVDADMDGIRTAQGIHENSSATAIIMLTSVHDDDLMTKALRMGANGYLLKNLSAAQLIVGVRAAYLGLSVMSPETFSVQFSRATTPGELPELTQREAQVLEQLMSGHSNAEIAQALFLSQSAVKTHMTSLMTKFGTRSRLETLVRALRLGFNP